MVQKTTPLPLTHIDCACVIHGTGYDWMYVDHLYNMLCRHLSLPIKFHVYTEAHRPVPSNYIKHELQDMGFLDPKQSWWYKLQLFNTEHHMGPLLYFDLDVVIVNSIDWIWKHNLTNFWSIKDFKFLYKPTHQGINSSVMWWDTTKYAYIWNDIKTLDFQKITSEFRGDQDYISHCILPPELQYFDSARIKSWRWQCYNGGYDFIRKKHLRPELGTVVDSLTSVLIFHGKPNPHEVNDVFIKQHWK